MRSYYLCALLALAAPAGLAPGGEPVVWQRDGLRYYLDARPGASGLFDSPCAGVWAQVGGRVFFAANDGVHGCEPHVYGAVDAVPLLLANIGPEGGSSRPSDFTPCGDLMFFTASSVGVQRRDLWVSDGSPEGTYWVKDINLEGDADISRIACIDGQLYFRADDGVHGAEPWTSDGTPEGTYMLSDVNPEGGSTPGNFTKLGDRILFTANDGVHGNELHRLIEGPPGSELVIDILPGPDFGGPQHYTPFKDGLVLSATIAPATGELFFTDGTALGTHLVKVINDVWQSPFERGSNPREFTVLGDVVVFHAVHNVFGREPWRSDGTAEGTYLLKDIDPRPFTLLEGTSRPSNFVRFGDYVYFRADDEEGNQDLWRTDGTPEGTMRVEGPAGEPIRNPTLFPEHRGFQYIYSNEQLLRLDAAYSLEIVVPSNAMFISLYHEGLFLRRYLNSATGAELGAQNAAPWVESFVPEEAGPTDAQEVGFLLRFSEPVTGVDPTDFALESPGLWGAAVVAADPLDDGQLWRVVVDTGLGDGSVSLRLVDDDSIVDTWALRWAHEADPPPLAPLEGFGTLDGSFDSAGGTLIDKPAPTVLLSSPAPPRTGIAPIPVTVAFERPVTGFTAESLLVENATVQDFSGSGADYAFSLMPLAFGALWAQVPADAAVDGGGLGNAPSNMLQFDYDLGALLHAADQNGDGLINLSELLRVVQFYNTAGYHCEAPDAEDPEDAYKAGPGADTACLPHSSDYKPQDWAISLSELLRLVQFYNGGGYHYCADAQEEGDGYCAGPDPQG